MKKNVYMAVLVLLFVSSEAFAGFDKNAICKEATLTIWQKNWAGCMRAFKNGIDAKQVESNWVNLVCDCIADELVNKLSCEEIKRLDKDEKFSLDLNKKINGICSKKVPPKK